MKFETKNVPAPSSIAAGASIIVDRFERKTVIVGGTFNATCRIEGSLDGSHWEDLSGDIASPRIIPIPHTLLRIRVLTTAWVSGAIVATFGGMDSRST